MLPLCLFSIAYCENEICGNGKGELAGLKKKEDHQKRNAGNEVCDRKMLENREVGRRREAAVPDDFLLACSNK